MIKEVKVGDITVKGDENRIIQFNRGFLRVYNIKEKTVTFIKTKGRTVETISDGVKPKRMKIKHYLEGKMVIPKGEYLVRKERKEKLTISKTIPIKDGMTLTIDYA